jgi:hypothetical protein
VRDLVFLLGIAPVFTGRFSPAEIILAVIVGIASASGLVAAVRQGTALSLALRLGVVLDPETGLPVLRCAAHPGKPAVIERPTRRFPPATGAFERELSRRQLDLGFVACDPAAHLSENIPQLLTRVRPADSRRADDDSNFHNVAHLCTHERPV